MTTPHSRHSRRFPARWPIGVLCAAALLAPLVSLTAQRTAPLGPTVANTQPASRAPAPRPPEAGGTPLTKQDVDAWLDGFMPYALKTATTAPAMSPVLSA